MAGLHMPLARAGPAARHGFVLLLNYGSRGKAKAADIRDI